MSDKNEIIRSAAAQVAENYRKSDIFDVRRRAAPAEPHGGH